MKQVFICDYVRTPIGRYGGTLSSTRADDLLTYPLQALRQRNKTVDWDLLDEVYIGCANQAGEDNRNVARMSLLLAGYSPSIPATTINRLCGSGMDAVAMATRAIKSGEIALAIAGGVESMSRAPFVMPKAQTAFSRDNAIYDTTLGWRFINPLMQERYGVDSMPETAENVAQEFQISRQDQDAFALASQQKTQKAMVSGRLTQEITPVSIKQRKKEAIVFAEDEHPRASSNIEGLAKLPTPFRENGSITAGNSSGINDGACALLIASEAAVAEHQLTPLARIISSATAGVEPRIMGFAPSPAIKKLLHKTKMTMDQFDVIELNEAFAAQVLSVMRDLHIADDDPRVNINGGAIALGHPLGMSGARITGTAALELHLKKHNYALAAMCIGVGQGIAIALAAC